jgi:crossover junction endodeoxyribonuclease RuvC
MMVLGVDPGTSCTGYGLISSDRGSLEHITHGVIRVGAKCPLSHRLVAIYRGIKDVMDTHGPQFVAVEGIFHARNARSSLMLGHARGVILLAAIHASIEVHEYSALQVKQALTGYGRAEKEQIRARVKSLLSLNETPPMDASDALALAICHAQSQRMCQRLRMLS